MTSFRCIFINVNLKVCFEFWKPHQKTGIKKKREKKSQIKVLLSSIKLYYKVYHIQFGIFIFNLIILLI